MNALSETRSPSSSVGDYLKAIWELAEGSGGAAPTKDVAAQLSSEEPGMLGTYGEGVF
jgi:Mn-dependent DtxR family transcriptional regulator